MKTCHKGGEYVENRIANQLSLEFSELVEDEHVYTNRI